MFDEHMKTPAIPERIFALCKLLKTKDYNNAELRELLEPSHVGGTTGYYGMVRTAAEQLGLISIKENTVSLVVEHQDIGSMVNLRKYIIKNISNLKGGLFYEVTKEYLQLDAEVLHFKSLTDKKIIDYMCRKTGKKVIEDDMRAWRFWGSFLGFGYLHEMLLLPNMYQYLMDVFELSNMEKNVEYSFDEFISMVYPYCESALGAGLEDHRLNFAISNGLRALHDNNIIELQHKLDGGISWFLYKSEIHSIKSTVTHITIRG